MLYEARKFDGSGESRIYCCAKVKAMNNKTIKLSIRTGAKATAVVARCLEKFNIMENKFINCRRY